MRYLHLNLKKEWFDLILSGEKKEEYREIKPYWDSRLKKNYDRVIFKNGYSRGAREMVFDIKSIKTGIGRQEWGAPPVEAWIISLGDFVNE